MKSVRVPVLGETLYSLNVGNSARGRDQIITPCEVTKVGRKYFEITFKNHWRSIVFHIDNWREKTEYSSNFYLYESPQQWEDEKESKKLLDIISRAVQHGHNNKNLSLKQIQDIMKIIESNLQ